MAFEDILGQIADEAERTSFQEIATKHPLIKERIDYGEAFAPVAIKLREVDPSVDPIEQLKYLPQWMAYQGRNWDAEKKMYRREAEALEENSRLRVELDELRLKGVDGMTTEDFKALMASEGVLTKADLDKAKYVTQDGVMSAMAAQAKQFETIYAVLTPQTVEHAKKFGEAIPVQDVFSYMEKTGERDPRRAYDAVIAPKVRELELAQHQQELEQARKDAKEEGRREAQQSVTGRGMPVDSKGSSTGVGRFMSRILGKRDERSKTGGSGRLGDGTAAMEGYGKWQQKQMSGNNG